MTDMDATEAARDVISRRLAIEYEDSDIAADVVTYRIVEDLKRDGIAFTFASQFDAETEES